MHRQSKSPLKVKENKSGCLEEKDEASFPLPKEQKICKGTKFRVLGASKKENLSGGSEAWSLKRALKSPKGLGEELCHPQGGPGGCCALQGDVGTEPTLHLSRKENFAGSTFGSLGNDSYSTPERARAEGKPDFGIAEEQREKPVDFAAVTVTEFGIAPESFTKLCKGNSTSLKYRRRSTVGLRGSPENNTLIRYLAQQRGKRQKAPFTQISPFKHANVRSLKDKMETFQTSFESLQEAEGEAGPSGLPQGEDSQEGGSSQGKVPFKKEPNLEQWSEKFTLDRSGADLKENCRENVSRSSKSDPSIYSILSPNPGMTEPAAPQEWVYGQKNPPESLESVATGDTLERGHVSRSELSPAHDRSTAVSAVSRRRVGFVEGLSLGLVEESRALSTPPATPLGARSTPCSDLGQSGSLRSILKKTPTRRLLPSPKEYLNDSVGRGGGESVPVLSYEKTFEASETENTESLDFRTPKKKKVTFGQVLSPEIFDQTLPANTPLRRGASPGPSSSPSPGPDLNAEPLPRLPLDWDDECVELPQEFLEASSAAEDPSPVENAEAPTDKPKTIKTRSSAKRKRPAQAEKADCSPRNTGDTKNPGNAEEIQNPRKKKIQGQKEPSTSSPKKPRRPRQTSYRKRRKKKATKTLYGEREKASKKPLLSPIPEVPEVFFSLSSPRSPKADGLFSEEAAAGNPQSWNVGEDVPEKAVAGGMRGKSILPAAALDPSPEPLPVAAPSSSRAGPPQLCQGDLEPASGTQQEVSTIVPEGGFDTSEHFQQGNLLELLQQQATDVHMAAHGTPCPQTGSVSGSPARRRRRRSSSSSATYLPPVENLEISGTDFSVSSYNVEEVLCAPRGSLQPWHRRSSTRGDTRVRRSMRLSKGAGGEGLAWVQLPRELPKQPPPLAAPAPKSRRRGSTDPILGRSENLQPREQKPSPFWALGKENEDSAYPAAGPGRGRRRRSAPTAPETTWAQTQQRRSTSSVNKKDRKSTKRSEEAEMPLEVTPGEVLALSDFLK